MQRDEARNCIKHSRLLITVRRVPAMCQHHPLQWSPREFANSIELRQRSVLIIFALDQQGRHLERLAFLGQRPRTKPRIKPNARPTKKRIIHVGVMTRQPRADSNAAPVIGETGIG